jgi:hypothetical protein
VCRITLLLFLFLTGNALAEDYQFADIVNYDHFGGSGYAFSAPVAVATPTVSTSGKSDPPPIRISQFGRDRIIILTAKWCPHCPHDKLKQIVPALRKAGWTAGDSPANQIQILDADDNATEFDRIARALRLDPVKLPLIAKVEGGEITRRFEQGCGTPLDVWSIGWLYSGTDERPDREKEPATIKRSGSYPLTGGWWSVEGVWNPSRDFVIKHLLGGSIHRGKFDAAWVKSLSLAELQSLHTDDHTGRVRWAFVNKYGTAEPKRSAAKSEPVTPPRKISSVTVARSQPAPVWRTSSCPTGNCPLNRRYR